MPMNFSPPIPSKSFPGIRLLRFPVRLEEPGRQQESFRHSEHRKPTRYNQDAALALPIATPRLPIGKLDGWEKAGSAGFALWSAYSGPQRWRAVKNIAGAATLPQLFFGYRVLAGLCHRHH